jgi:hypothetical protein
MKSPRSMVSLAVSPFRAFAGWVTYWHFKWKQSRAKKKVRKDDPNIYPLW